MAGDIATQVVAKGNTREYQGHEALKHTISLRVLRGIAEGSATHVVAKSTTTNTENKGIATIMIARRIPRAWDSAKHMVDIDAQRRQEQKYYNEHIKLHKQNIIGDGIQNYESRKAQEAM